MKQKLRVGDWVEVRSREEILRTLDGNGQLEGTPFMPEMLKFCGRRFQVYKSSHKTCDYTTQYPYHTRRMKDTIHLETRCDGTAHGGCQAACLLYWKTAWLKPVSADKHGAVMVQRKATSGCTESQLWANACQERQVVGGLTYICQATQVNAATKPLAWWDIRQYLEDYFSGNVRLERLISGLAYSAYFHLSQAGIGLGPAMRWFYNKFHRFWGGTPFPRKRGSIPEGVPTPTAKLNLQPGELVRIKTQDEILQTVDGSNRNRGMYWDAELVPYCGGTYRVLNSVSRLIDEKTGKMLEMKNPCVVLDKVVCQARYSPCRMLCPKEMYPYWREVWLERVQEPAMQPGSTKPAEKSSLSPAAV